MNKALGTYVAVFGVMLALDLLWLGAIARPLYQQAIGRLMAERPNIPVAVLFYTLYAVGITVFAVWPHAAEPGWRTAMVMGGLFGFFAYATYDLTNLATLEGWPWSIAVVDMAWGAFASGVSAAAGKLILDRFSA